MKGELYINIYTRRDLYTFFDTFSVYTQMAACYKDVVSLNPTICVPESVHANISVQVFCTWLVTVSASGAQVTVEPLATGVSTRLVCPRSWQGRGCRTEGLEATVVADRSVDDREWRWGATTVKVWEEIVPLNIFFLASSTCHRRKMLFILILYISFFLQFITQKMYTATGQIY